MDQPLWVPSRRRVSEANLTRFIKGISDCYPVDDYASLYQWSINRPREFWGEFWNFCQPLSVGEWTQVVDDPTRLPGARWFEGVRLNFAENLLRYRDRHPAITSWTERGFQTRLTYLELYRQVARLAGALQKAGVKPGDRVAGFLPNRVETVVAMLATTWLGAIWSSCSPDFGVKGVLDRFGQIQPRVLFAAAGYHYAGKKIDCLAKVRPLVRKLTQLKQVVIVPDQDPAPSLKGLPRTWLYQDFLATASPLSEFRRFDFAHPLYIMYSSGTTGLPKCMVHGAGGTLIQHLKELILHTDLKRSDNIFYQTTCGWMMWNWLMSALAVGATIVLYDGSPFAPQDDSLFGLADEAGLTIFGTSAKYLALVEKKGLCPRRTHSLKALRMVLSTGSPLSPQSFDYVYQQIKKDVLLASISGGTDLVSCFALGNPIGPVYRGELQTRGLGMKVEVFDSQGNSLVGRTGELVCTMAFPSMPIHFWDDPGQKRYRQAYFEHFPGVWRHGDWVELRNTGGLVFSGRSDATLNPGGVRIGTAEIYRQAEKIEEVIESLAVGQEWEGDVRVVLFVKLAEKCCLTSQLEAGIQSRIRAGASPHHLPAKIIQVSDLPRTISGKIAELAVRELIHGRPVDNVDALANPETLELFRDLEELRF